MPSSLRARFGGQTALVTGASSGIGADLARQLGAAGARVLLVARGADALGAVAAEIRAAGGAAASVPWDLEPPGAAAALADHLEAAGEAVGVLVNNAGYGVAAPLVETPVAAVEGQVGLNVAALTTLTRRLLPAMLARGRGDVLHVASIAAFAPTPRYAVYAATKAYVRQFSEALWYETRGTGVHVSCLAPGPVATGFGARAGVDEAFFDGAVPSADVARAGLEALARNRRLVVPGLVHKVETFATRFAPRLLTIAVAARRVARSV